MEPSQTKMKTVTAAEVVIATKNALWKLRTRFLNLQQRRHNDKLTKRDTLGSIHKPDGQIFGYFWSPLPS